MKCSNVIFVFWFLLRKTCKIKRIDFYLSVVRNLQCTKIWKIESIVKQAKNNSAAKNSESQKTKKKEKEWEKERKRKLQNFCENDCLNDLHYNCHNFSDQPNSLFYEKAFLKLVWSQNKHNLRRSLELDLALDIST